MLDLDAVDGRLFKLLSDWLIGEFSIDAGALIICYLLGVHEACYSTSKLL